MSELLVTALSGLSHGLLLFMLSAGLSLIFSLMGVLNFAHASFYMLGAYLGYTLSQRWGFGAALLLAPLGVGLLGAAFERWVLRRLRRVSADQGHVPELLVTFGLAYLILELVQLLWGRSALPFEAPLWLSGPAFTWAEGGALGGGWGAWFWGEAPAGLCAPQGTALCAQFARSRVLVMAVALLMLLLLALLLRLTRVGLVVQAALTHPQAVMCLGHDLPRVFVWVFGLGTGLAGLAGVIGGSTFVTEPAMAASLGSLVFVVVVIGGLGSLWGAFWASLLVGGLQTWAVGVDRPLLELLPSAWALTMDLTPEHPLLRLSLAQLAPLLPYALLVLVLVLRPKGLLGRREG